MCRSDQPIPIDWYQLKRSWTFNSTIFPCTLIRQGPCVLNKMVENTTRIICCVCLQTPYARVKPDVLIRQDILSQPRTLRHHFKAQKDFILGRFSNWLHVHLLTHKYFLTATNPLRLAITPGFCARVRLTSPICVFVYVFLRALLSKRELLVTGPPVSCGRAWKTKAQVTKLRKLTC